MAPRLLLIAALLPLGCASAPAPGPQPGPPPLGLTASDLFHAYLAARPPSLKMRHQVESRFAGRHEMLEGIALIERPRRFWLRAFGTMGATLFDVRRTQAGELVVSNVLPQLGDPRFPRYLAQDIARIYLEDCPPSATVRTWKDGVEASCGLTRPEPASTTDDDADDALRERIDASGQLVEKCFARGAHETACISYGEPTRYGSYWLARRIQLRHASLPYALTIVLVSADPTFDVAGAFARIEAP